ncbi:DUF6680 family protein [uncultured Hyphomonas sp.]|uniref:DUF6680 family protein n=1 Tax=uncultured Hyphomonas sp. TaxID=225298 RepID=UPI002AABCF42|nr:DUF6680 family protein [uncultured Hyphomonas sp.]
MTAADIVSVSAILLSPLIALRTSSWLEARKEVRLRKLGIYRTLMATRAQNLSHPHIEALNSIDLEFRAKNGKEKAVRDAWKLYLDHLNDRNYPAESWGVRRQELAVELLYVMGKAVGYDFDKVHIGKGIYSPMAHGRIEADQEAIRAGLRNILEKKSSIQVQVIGPDSNIQPDTD